MSYLLSTLILFCLAGQSHGNDQKTYEMGDLEILAAEENYQEFFQHARDILPSERQDKWRQLLGKMADGLGQKVLKKSEIQEEDFNFIENLYDWPALRKDDVFKLRRNEIGLRYLQSCLKKNSQCWGAVKDFWEKDTTDPELGFRLATISSQFPGSPMATWLFLESALMSPLSEFYCQKDLVISELWKKLELDYIRLGKKGSLVKKLDTTVHPKCLPSLNSVAKRRITFPTKEGDRELGYAILDSQGKLTTGIRDFFFTVYLLEHPSQGELFNLAWNNLKEMGRSFERRERILLVLKKLDLLPDQVAGSLDQMKKRVILSHFKANFPEFLDHYSNVCLNYFAGKGSFPRGNPTLHCQELMSSDVAPQIFDSYKIKEFQDTRKI